MDREGLLLEAKLVKSLSLIDSDIMLAEQAKALLAERLAVLYTALSRSTAISRDVRTNVLSTLQTIESMRRTLDSLSLVPGREATAEMSELRAVAGERVGGGGAVFGSNDGNSSTGGADLGPPSSVVALQAAAAAGAVVGGAARSATPRPVLKDSSSSGRTATAAAVRRPTKGRSQAAASTSVAAASASAAQRRHNDQHQRGRSQNYGHRAPRGRPFAHRSAHSEEDRERLPSATRRSPLLEERAASTERDRLRREYCDAAPVDDMAALFDVFDFEGANNPGGGEASAKPSRAGPGGTVEAEGDQRADADDVAGGDDGVERGEEAGDDADDEHEAERARAGRGNTLTVSGVRNAAASRSASPRTSDYGGADGIGETKGDGDGSGELI